MILLDANALIAYLLDEPAGPAVRALLRRGGAHMTSINLAEVADVMTRTYALDDEILDDHLSDLYASVLTIVPVGEPEARAAGRIRSHHFRRANARLSLADAVLIAAGSLAGVSIATGDSVVAAVAEREGVLVTRLVPGSRKQ